MTRYVGRFAPSPTGPLHAGSLVAALASYCDALAHGGDWLLRIEDIDPPREIPGAAHDIIDTLSALGFRWSREIAFQSTHDAAYDRAFHQLEASDLIYPCGCSRSEIAARATRRSADGEAVYPGICARGIPGGGVPRAWRMRMPDHTIAFEDRWIGVQTENPARDTGDIVLRRADGLWAYQLAVVVDDAAAGVTDVVRGDDLLHSTARQIAIYQALNVPVPRFMHVPVVRNTAGAKLSKQTHAQRIDIRDPLAALQTAAKHLGLWVPCAPTLREFWRDAPTAWARMLASRDTERHAGAADRTEQAACSNARRSAQ